MSHIEKMQILGIRSFGPDEGDKQTIQFFSPMTLILGQNGCGKTTIIESLKYATTGDMPPGCGKSGGSFVHDPKMAKEMLVRGQVKLKMSDVAGKSLIVTRSLEATQKAKKLEVRTLDGTVTRRSANDEPVSISSKCAEINSEMSAALGVSKPILNNVIFCHQEESNWPLDEGKRVKEKFDAIFNATKYIKCLDTIKKVRAGIKSSVGNVQTEIGFLRQYKELTQQKKDELSKLETKLNASLDKVNQINQQLEPINDRLEKICNKEKDIVKLQTDIEKNKNNVKLIEEQQEEIRANIEYEFQGSETELAEMLQNFGKQVKQKENELEKHKQQLQKVIINEDTLKRQLHKLLPLQGQLKTEETQQKDRIEERNRKLMMLTDELNLTGFHHTDVSSEDVEKVLAELKSHHQIAQENMQKMKHEFEAKEIEQQGKIDELREKKAGLLQAIEMNKRQKKQNISEIANLKRELFEAVGSASRIHLLTEKLNQVEKELEQVEKAVDVDVLKRDICEGEAEQVSLERKLEQLNKELTVLHAQSAAQTELEILKNNKLNKEESVNKLLSKHEDSLQHLLHTIPEQNIKYEFEACLDKLNEEDKEQSKEINDKMVSLSSKRESRRSLKEQLENKEKEVKENQEKVDEICGSQEFDEVMQNLQVAVQQLQDDRGVLGSSQHMYKKYIEELQKRTPRCPICHRGFDNDREVEELTQEMSRLIRGLPQQLKDNKKKLDTQQEKYNNMLQIKPVKQSMDQLKATVIPKLQSKLKTTSSTMNELEAEVEELQLRLEFLQVDTVMARSIQHDVILIDEHQKDVKMLQKKVQEQEEKMQGADTSHTYEQVQNEQEDVKHKVDSLRKQIEQKREKINNHTERIQKLKENRNSYMAEKLQLEGSQQKQHQLECQKSELESAVQKLEKEIKEVQQEVTPLDGKIATEERERKRFQRQKEQKVEEKRREVEELRRQERELQEQNSLIQQYLEMGQPQKLADINKNLEDLNTKGRTLEEEKNSVQQTINDTQNVLSKQQVQERELQDNQILRQKEAKIKSIQEEVRNLKNRLGGLNYQTLRKEKNRLVLEEDKLISERHELIGRRKELENTISSLRRELNQDHFKNAEKKHKEKFIELKTKQMAAEDLNKYYMALDWAIMHFHFERMKTINGIIRELWRSIYRGNDIDYIEIKTDETDATAGADKRRNYNYRVVMVKNDTEMDMRSRCSAGQKVLAALIIRMALAETFSSNCGILALDEPTTNLDRENIESLSMALTDIVNKRAGQRNFQLIVITHDEEFLDSLTRVDKIECYYKVTRNNRGLSVIRKCGIEH